MFSYGDFHGCFLSKQLPLKLKVFKGILLEYTPFFILVAFSPGPVSVTLTELHCSQQGSLQALGTYWTASSRNQLILRSLFLIFHQKEEKTDFKWLVCIIINKWFGPCVLPLINVYQHCGITIKRFLCGISRGQLKSLGHLHCGE